MARTFVWRSAAIAAVVAAVAFGCQESVTAPGHCPDLCPSDSLPIADTVLTGIVAYDTSIRGFTELTQTPILLIANQDSLMAHTIMRFQAMPQSWLPNPNDTVSKSVGTIDSVTMDVLVEARDSLVHNLYLKVHRLPALIDSTVTYSSTLPYFADSTVIDSLKIEDSVRVANIHRKLPAGSIVPVDVDSFVTSLGLSLRSDSQTSVVISSSDFTVTPPLLKFYVHAAAPDTNSTIFILAPTMDMWVQTPGVPPTPPQTIVVGNQPASRAFVKFQIPSYFVDSVSVIRASLLMTPTRPPTGFPRATFGIEAIPVLRYFAGKSLLIQDTTVAGHGTVTVGATTTISLEMGRVMKLWHGQPVDSLPRTVVLRTVNESFEIGQFDVAGALSANPPKLQISYIRPFKFGVP